MSIMGMERAGRPTIPYQMDRNAAQWQVAEKQAPTQTENRDSVQISQEAREHARGLTQNELASMKEQIASAKQQADAAKKELDNLAKCFKIAMRIMAGDLVPNKDKRFLAEEQPKLYMQALSMQRPNANPEKHKSLLAEEEESVEGQSADAGGELPAPESVQMPEVPEMAAAESEPSG